MSETPFIIRYYAEKLAESTAETDEIQKKLWQIPIEPFTIEEQIRLRYLLEEIASYTRLLNAAVTDEMENETKKSRFKKFLKK